MTNPYKTSIIMLQAFIEQCEQVIDRLQAQKKYEEVARWQRLYRYLVAYRLQSPSKPSKLC